MADEIKVTTTEKSAVKQEQVTVPAVKEQRLKGPAQNGVIVFGNGLNEDFACKQAALEGYTVTRYPRYASLYRSDKKG